MPSFDFTSEADMVALKNAVDVVARQIENRYDFKGSAAHIALDEKSKSIVLQGDSEFQLDQIKDLLFPAMEKKEKESVKRLDAQPVQKMSGNKVKQELKIRSGIDSELAKKIVKLIKDAKLKAQASIQGDGFAQLVDFFAAHPHRIALVRSKITDFPIKDGNYRD